MKHRSLIHNITLASLLWLNATSVQAQWGGAERAANVLVEPITFEYEKTKIDAVGTAEAVSSVVLYPAVADRVIAVNFVPGQKVQNGDVLLRLDDRRERVALERAQVERANAQRNYDRIRNSHKEGAVTQSDLDNARTTFELAQIQVKEAQADLDDRVVVAPFDGVVGLTDIEVGDRINLQTVVTTIDARERLLINFRAPESALSVLTENPTVNLQPWADRTQNLQAIIAEVDSRINVDDRTIRARAMLDNDNDLFRPGMSFRVSLTTLGERYASIPESALLWGATGAYVWKSVDDKAVRVPVDIKQRLRGRILVEGDLFEGENLIAEGVQRLRPGQAVKSQNTQIAERSSQGESRG